MMVFVYTYSVILTQKGLICMNTKSINDKIIQYPILNDVSAALKLKNLSQNTITNYLDGIARFLDFIEYDNLFPITEDHFRDYLFYINNLNHNKKTVNCYNSFIRFFFLAVLNIPINPYRVPMAKTVSKEVHFLTDYQIAALLNATAPDSRFDCIVKLGICCGLRINEIVSLKVCDINTRDTVKHIYIRESKRNKSRYVPMDNTVYMAIQRYAKEYHIKPGTSSFLFQFSNAHLHTCNETIRRHFNGYKSLANIDDSFTFHCLRHTFAVHFLADGGDLLDLKYRLGHSSLSTTSLYLHFSRNLSKPRISYLDRLIKRGI